MALANRIINRLLQLYRQYGIVGSIQHTIRGRNPVQHGVAYYIDSPIAEHPIKDMTISRYVGMDQLTDAHRAQLTAKNFDIEAVRLQRKFAQGRELWVGDIGGTVAAVCWSRSYRKRKDYFVPLEPTDSTILACYTVSRFRGRGLYPAMLRHMINTFLAQGQKRIFIDCGTWNTPSMRGIEKAGFKQMGTSWRIVLRGKVWYFLNRCKI